jgi:glycerol-3-phosphate acyltransferase PlsY
MFFIIPITRQGNNYAIYFISLFFGFLAGSIPFGYILARIRGIDIRKQGSKNIGFTNVNRVLGLVYALPVLILDVAKGFFPTYFASRLEFIPVLVGFGAIIGHIFTPWLSFKGGKGVATTIGVFSALAPLALVCCLGIFILVLSILSYVSAASLGFALFLPIFSIILYSDNKTVFLLALISAIIVIVRHKENITRLIQKTEPKFSFLRLKKERV